MIASKVTPSEPITLPLIVHPCSDQKAANSNQRNMTSDQTKIPQLGQSYSLECCGKMLGLLCVHSATPTDALT